MKSSPVGLRIPDSILSQIDGQIGQLGKNRSEVILALLQQALQPPGGEAAILAKLDRLLAIAES